MALTTFTNGDVINKIDLAANYLDEEQADIEARVKHSVTQEYRVVALGASGTKRVIVRPSVLCKVESVKFQLYHSSTPLTVDTTIEFLCWTAQDLALVGNQPAGSNKLSYTKSGSTAMPYSADITSDLTSDQELVLIPGLTYVLQMENTNAVNFAEVVMVTKRMRGAS